METVKMSECSEEDLDPSDHMTGAGHGRRNIPMRRDSRFYRSVRRRRSNKTGPATEPADNRDCKEDVMNSTSERNSDCSPCWRSPVPQKPALSPLLLGPTSAFKPGIKLNLNGEPTGLIPGGAHAALIQELSGMLQENRLSSCHSEPSRALSDSTVPMEALSQHISCCNIQKGRPPQGKQGEDLNDIDNISVRLLDGESLVGRQAEDQAVTATIGPPAEAWKNLIAQRTGVLYQEYGTQSRLQEIQHRRQCDAESHGEPAVRDSALPLQLCRDSPSSTMKLWQNREAVRSSGVLSVLSTEKRQHQEAMFELVTSETSYYKSLELLVTHFQENHQLIQSLSQSEAHFIFSNIRDVKDVSERFLLDLERRVEENVIISDVCDIVSWHASQHFHEFVTYVSNQTYQQRACRRILKENESFREVMSGLEQAPQCKGLPFTSFLILPFQRITRLKLLVQNILKKVEEGSEKEASAVMAHKHLEKVVRDCNEGVRKMSRTEELISIEKTLEFKCKSVPVISHSRWLLKRGELQLMSGPKSTRTLRSRKLFQPLYLFLFNNLLLVTRRSSSGEKFYVLDSALRSMLRTEEQQDQGKALSNIFSLCLLENQEERTVNYMLKACSPSDKKRWISALTPNPRTKFFSANTHQSDSPQVQCVHLYVSQEPDELSLDLADVLNVVEQTEDGWMLGERLHDREKGWFPCKVVEEIHNQELRAQNLRECHRIYRTQESRPRSNHRLGSRARHSRVAPS